MSNAVPQDDLPSSLAVPEHDLPDEHALAPAPAPSGASREDRIKAMRGTDYSANLSRSMLRGETFGLSDRGEAFLRSLTGGSYKDELGNVQAAKDAFHKEHPVIDTAANVAGNAITASGPLKAAGNLVPAGVKEAVAKLPKLFRYGGAGAAFGAAGGAAEAPYGKAAQGAKTGAKVGAALGAGVPAAVIGGSGVLKSKPVQHVAQRTADVFKEPFDNAVARIAREAARHHLTPAEIRERLAKLPGGVLGDQFKDLFRNVASKPGQTMPSARKLLEGRAEQKTANVLDSAFKGLNVNDVNVDATIRQLHQNMRTIADTHGYDRILDSGHVDLTPEIEKMMKAEGTIMRAALQHSRNAIKNDIDLGEVTGGTEKYFRELPTGEVEFVPVNEKAHLAMKGERPRRGKHTFTIDAYKTADLKPAPDLPGDTAEVVGEVAERPTLRAWDYVKRGLDRFIAEERKDNYGKLTEDGRKAAIMRGRLEKHMTEGNSAYKAIRTKYASEKQGEEAIMKGREFMSQDAETTAFELEHMTDAEKQFFRLGAARALFEQPAKLQARRLRDEPAFKNKIRSIFGPGEEGETAFKNLIDSITNEADKQATSNAVLGGSVTGRVLAGQEDIEAPIGAAADMVTGGWMGGLKSALAHAADTQWAERRRDELGRQLMLPPGPEREKILNAVEALFNKRFAPPPSAPAALPAPTEKGAWPQ